MIRKILGVFFILIGLTMLHASLWAKGPVKAKDPIANFLENGDEEGPQVIHDGNRLDPSSLVPQSFQPQPVQKNPYSKWPKRIFVDPDQNSALITKEPGLDWGDCEKSPNLCLSRPNSDTYFERDLKAPLMEKYVVDPRTGLVETRQYIKVKYQFAKPWNDESGSEQSGEGWIDVDQMRPEYQEPMYPVKRANEITVGPKKNCPVCVDKDHAQPQSPAEKKNIESLKDIQRKVESPSNLVQESFEKMKPLAGQCPLRPPTQKKAAWLERDGMEGPRKVPFIYDREALPLIRQSAKRAKAEEVPMKIPPGKSNPEPATTADLVAVDTLARTLYSEFGECFRLGLQYPMAGAKTAINRVKRIEAGTAPLNFARKSGSTDKPLLSEVLTAPMQYAVWSHHGVANKNDKTILMSLCPSRDDSEMNWAGRKPDPADKNAWEKALQIATEAVLYPDRFEERTKEVKQSYYTAKMDRLVFKRKNANAVSFRIPNPIPKIEGRPIAFKKCINLWEEP